MKKYELKEGLFYIAGYNNESHLWAAKYTIKWGKPGSQFYVRDDKKFSKGANFFPLDGYEIAPDKNKQHLEACIAADKFIPLEEVKSIESVPEYVECVKEWRGPGNSIIGEIYNTKKPQSFSSHTWEGIFKDSQNDGYAFFKPSTKEAYDAQQAPKEEDLLAKAKRDYPIGTRFRNQMLSSIYTVGGEWREFSDGDIAVKSKESNISWYSVYCRGKWAEIIPSEEIVSVDNLVKGEVYYLDANVHWLLTFERYEDDRIWGVYVMRDSRKIHRGINLAKSSIKSIRKATPEERALLYPKIVESKPEEKPMKELRLPKKGEWWTIDNLKSGNSGEIGKAFEVRSKNVEDENSWVMSTDQTTIVGGSWYAKELRPSTEAEIQARKKELGIITEAPKEEEKWKVGGWVRLKEKYGYNEIGTIAQIKKHLGDGRITLDLPLHREGSQDCNVFTCMCEWIGMNYPGEGFSCIIHEFEMRDLKVPHLEYLSDFGEKGIPVYPGAGVKKNVDALPHQKAQLFERKRTKSILI